MASVNKIENQRQTRSGAKAAAVLPSDPLLDKCLETVRKYHLPFQVLNITPGIGDCFFAAIFDQIQYNEAIRSTVSESA